MKALLIALALLATACHPPQPTRLEQCRVAVDEFYKALCESGQDGFGSWVKPCDPPAQLRSLNVLKCMRGFGE